MCYLNSRLFKIWQQIKHNACCACHKFTGEIPFALCLSQTKMLCVLSGSWERPVSSRTSRWRKHPLKCCHCEVRLWGKPLHNAVWNLLTHDACKKKKEEEWAWCADRGKHTSHFSFARVSLMQKPVVDTAGVAHHIHNCVRVWSVDIICRHTGKSRKAHMKQLPLKCYWVFFFLKPLWCSFLFTLSRSCSENTVSASWRDDFESSLQEHVFIMIKYLIRKKIILM